ncbi:unnamed protein product [Cunninghamella blakesleeana]
MNISDMLNPTDIMSPPLSPKSPYSSSIMNEEYNTSNTNDHHTSSSIHGKPRSRFSELEDAIICEGVAKGLTWGQISNQLPHRKRATCFNRYRTLQGIRKSRKRSSMTDHHHPSVSLQHKKYLPHSPTTSPPSLHSTPSMSPRSISSWTPTTPPAELYLSSYPLYPMDDPLIRKLSITKDHILPPIYTTLRSSSSSSIFDRSI